MAGEREAFWTSRKFSGDLQKYFIDLENFLGSFGLF